MKLPNPKIQTINNITEIAGKSISGGVVGAASIAYIAGAEAIAEMFRDAIASGDLNNVIQLAKETEKKSFYFF